MSSRAGKKRTKTAMAAAAAAAAASASNANLGEDDANNSAGESQDDSSSQASKKTRLTSANAAKQLAELEDQLRQAREGRFPPDVAEKLAQAEAAKQRDLNRAQLVRDLKLKEVEAHHEFCVQEAGNSYAHRRNELVQTLLSDLEERIKQLNGVVPPPSQPLPSSAAAALQQQQAKKPQQASAVAATTAATAAAQVKRPRSKSLESEAGTGGGDESQPEEEEDLQQASAARLPTAAAAAKPQPKKSLRLISSKVNNGKDGNANQTLDSFVLASKEDVLGDLEQIHANWLQRAEAAAQSSAIQSTEDCMVHVQDGNKLVVGATLVLEKGSQVIVTRRGLDDEVLAVITKVSANEVMIKQQEENNAGLSARIPVSQLKSGRCAIRAQPSEPSAAAATTTTTST